MIPLTGTSNKLINYMNKKQINQKKIQLGLKTNWKQFTTVLLMVIVLVFFWAWCCHLFLKDIGSERLYFEQESQNGMIYHNEQEKLTTGEILPNLPIVARVTCYQPTGNLTASGKVPKNGMVAVSDRSIPFGTEIIINGQTYIVEDRTAYWVFTDFEHLTVDIFMEDGCDLDFGASLKDIIINN